mgnify:CR=1 FL=1
MPPGAPGEAWLGGDGVMLGYLNDAEANEACLRPNPFSARPGALLYRSGDRVTLRATMVASGSVSVSLGVKVPNRNL